MALDLQELLRRAMQDVLVFAQAASGIRLRGYQEGVARAVVESVVKRKGLTFVVMFPRQSGKNELQAQIECYLLTIFSQLEAEMVKVSPTWKPQTLNAMRRLQRVLERNLICRDRWEKESGYIFKVGKARIFFLSGGPTANVVGATASTLLECDEAQDVLAVKWDKDFSPMAASTNATRVFWGTAWTSRTLLARERRAAEAAEAVDGERRVFVLTAEDVAREVPAYGQFVREQVAKMGRNHPLVKTQFFSEEIDAEGGMFPSERQAMLRGTHQALQEPRPGGIYAMLLDVAGEDEGLRDEAQTKFGAGLENPERDSTAVTVVEVDLGTLSDALLQAPSYRVVHRRLWTGVKHARLYGELRGLVEHWGRGTAEVRYLVADATGVGAGLVSFLESALPKKVVPFVFSAKSKSDLGWGFLAAIETGRFKDFGHPSSPSSPALLPQGEKGERGGKDGLQAELQGVFWEQVENAQASILDGPGRLMRWGVPDGTRSVETGELVHDDLLLSAALCAELDKLEWSVGGAALIVKGRDPLEAMDREGF